MEDFDGLTNQNPFRTIIRMNEDESPTVVIRQPSADVMMNEPGELDIIYQATDDFGIERAELNWELSRAYVDEPERSQIQLSTPQNGRISRYTWDLSAIDLRPRDEVTFSIRAMDNDQIAGGKWGRSKEIVIRIPSLAEFFDEMDEKERDVQSELDNVSESFDQMEQEYERFMERLRNNPEGGFEEQEMLESVSEKQQQIDETVKQLQEQFSELRQEMEESNSVSEETLESYRELQQLMDELDDPDLQNALDELREAMENMNPNQMEDALENVSFNEELYKERLERTKELFKTLKMNSDLNKLAEQYEDLSERVNSEDNESIEQLEREMETARQDMDQVSEQLEQLDQNPPKRAAERLKQIKEEAQQELDQIKEQADELQQNASDQKQQGEQSPSEQMKQQQQQMSQQLQQQAEKMRQMQQQMSGQQLQVNILALQRALYTLLELSDTQEYLTQDAQETAQRSSGYVSLAREQNYVQDQFSSVADSIFQISSEIPGIPNRINRKKEEVERTLRNSVSEMAERNQRGATIASRESLGGINDLSSLIASLIDQLMNQSGGSGSGGGMSSQQMMEQLQQMSGDQQQLNQQLQQMVNDMQGDRLSREQSDRLDQLARQQNEIRKQLQELQRSGALKDGDRMMSDLQRMMDEMEDSINDMRGGVTDDLMIERQQNILSRMLSAEDAMEQRGEDEEREGSEADQLNYDLPPDMTLEELQQEIRSRLQDPDYTRFSEEYQRLIELYFERIRRMNEEVLP
jgi:methyl-accepting chemotaxis protein